MPVRAQWPALRCAGPAVMIRMAARPGGCCSPNRRSIACRLPSCAFPRNRSSLAQPACRGGPRRTTSGLDSLNCDTCGCENAVAFQAAGPPPRTHAWLRPARSGPPSPRVGRRLWIKDDGQHISRPASGVLTRCPEVSYLRGREVPRAPTLSWGIARVVCAARFPQGSMGDETNVEPTHLCRPRIAGVLVWQRAGS